LELPVEECETVESTMRQIEFLDAEIAEVDRLIAQQTLRCGDARHLLTVPGVNVVCAATFLGAIGDVRRFRTSRQMMACLGLDPKVRQSGSDAALLGGSPNRDRRGRAGRWSKRATA
jgi:transposase